VPFALVHAENTEQKTN